MLNIELSVESQRRVLYDKRVKPSKEGSVRNHV